MIPIVSRFACLLGLPLLLLTGLARPSVAQGIDVETQNLESWSAERLAASFDAISTDLLGQPLVLTPQLILALGMAEIATDLDPESLEIWRRLFEVATALEADVEGAADARKRAIEALVRLDPDDPVMRLRLLLDRIESRPTAQARIEAYQTLLDPENLERLGNRAGSRLAFDLGLLQMRVGNLDAAANHVAQAVRLDPTFPQAAEMAAGMFRSVVPTPIDEAELITIAWTASPADGLLARTLGQLVLADGDFANAENILDLALDLTPEAAAIRSSVVADRMLALWGEGQAAEALALADRETRNRTTRRKRVLLGDGVDPDVVQATDIPPAPEIALIAAVIKARQNDPEAREAAVETLFRAYRFELLDLTLRVRKIQDDQDLPENRRTALMKAAAKRRAGLFADQAWARAWFGWQPTESAPVKDGEEATATRLSLKDLLDGAVQGGELDPNQRGVIEGWAAIEQEDFSQARLLLVPAAESSPYAEAGLAILDEVTGLRKEAATRYLAVYESRPGTLVGLWSRSRLEAMLGVGIPNTERSELMAEMLAQTLPDALGRAIRDPRHGVLSVTINPASLRQVAFEPTVVEIVITNVSGLELAIGPDSPIAPTIAVVADVADVVGIEDRPEAFRLSRPTVVSIDRRFSLPPQGSIRIELDLTQTSLARDIALASVFGGSFKLRAVVNFTVASSGNIDGGVFGREGTSSVFRVDGLDPLAGDRYLKMVRDMKSADTVADAKDIASMLGLVLPRPGEDPDITDSEVLSRTIDACLGLPAIPRAWVMSFIIPGTPGTTRLVDGLVSDGGAASLALALSRFSATPTSAPINAGLKSDDVRIRRMAQAARDLATLAEVSRQNELVELELDVEPSE